MGVGIYCPLAIASVVATCTTYLKISVRYRQRPKRTTPHLPSLRFSAWRLVWCGRTVRSLLIVLLGNTSAGLLAAGLLYYSVPPVVALQVLGGMIGGTLNPSVAEFLVMRAVTQGGLVRASEVAKQYAITRGITDWAKKVMGLLALFESNRMSEICEELQRANTHRELALIGAILERYGPSRIAAIHSKYLSLPTNPLYVGLAPDLPYARILHMVRTEHIYSVAAFSRFVRLWNNQAATASVLDMPLGSLLKLCTLSCTCCRHWVPSDDTRQRGLCGKGLARATDSSGAPHPAWRSFFCPEHDCLTPSTPIDLHRRVVGK